MESAVFNDPYVLEFSEGELDAKLGRESFGQI